MHTRHDLAAYLVRTPLLAVVVLQAAGGCTDASNVVSPKKEAPPRLTLTIVSGDRQTAEVGTALPQPLVVILRDSLGAPIARVLVRFDNEDGATADSVLTDEHGLASVRWTLGPKATTQRIVALAAIYAGTAYTVANAAFTATALTGPAARVQVTAADDFALPGSPLDTVAAVVVDRFDNRVAGAPIEWRVELGGGSVRALSTETNALGVARAIWTLGPSSGENVLTVTSASLAGRLAAFASVAFPAVSVAVGGEHTCGLTRQGTAYCWGSNAMGQLGVGTTDGLTNAWPIRVAGGLAFTQLVAGTFHTCGLTSAGGAYCWGGNYSGQLGFDGAIATTPTRVAAPQSFSALAVGSHHTCGLTTGGIIYCWGDNSVGELGDGSDRSAAVSWGVLRRPTPAPIVGGLSFVALAANYSATCAVATTGQTYCWGGNSGRELGTVSGNCRMLADPWYYREDWDWPCSTKPVPIDSRESLTALTASGFSVCGVTTAGGLMCWGSGEAFPPTVVPGARVSVAWTLGNIVCGVDGSSEVACWGLWGRMGPTPPPFGLGITLENLRTTGSTSCGLSRQQPAIAYCWGHNYKGQVGDGTTVYREIPVAVGLPRASR